MQLSYKSQTDIYYRLSLSDSSGKKYNKSTKNTINSFDNF